MTEGASLAELMTAAQQGDQDAYRQLLEGIQPIVYGYVRRRLRSHETAEDVSQEVLMTVHRVRHTYDPDRPFELWLFAIARSRLIDHLRRARRLTAYEVVMDDPPEIPQAPAQWQATSMLEILDRIPAGQREAFSMLKIEGLSTEEAAARAGISVSALKVRAHRAYKTIKKSLSSDDDA